MSEKTLAEKRKKSTSDRDAMDMFQALDMEVAIMELKVKRRKLSRKFKKEMKIEKRYFKAGVLQALKMVKQGKKESEIIVELGLK